MPGQNQNHTRGRSPRTISGLRGLTATPSAVPLGLFTMLGQAAWFTNVLFLLCAAFVLLWVVRGPLAVAPRFFKKILKLGSIACLYLGVMLILISNDFWLAVAPFGLSRNTHGGWIFLAIMVFGGSAVFWILFARAKPQNAKIATSVAQSLPAAPVAVKRPSIRFSDVGGMEKEKELICRLIQSRLNPAVYKRYGVTRNGILFYGPQGSGKTFLATASAGEFGLNFWYVSSTALIEKWIGATSGNIRAEFAAAAAYKPVVFFIDEIDSLGSGRQTQGGSGDPGGAGREFNTVVLQLMQSIDHFREVPGFILMAATNLMDGLDEALIRPGRFDLKIRVDLPDDAARLKIFEALLAGKPSERFDLHEFVRKMPGASAAKIRALVDQAALFAADEQRKIGSGDLRRAFAESRGMDRPLIQPVKWEDIVISKDVEQDLRTLVSLLGSPDKAEKSGVDVPTGVLLLGPPGTGKSMIARLIASQTSRSFYPITAADVLGSLTGQSVKRISEVFARAKEHSPSIIFIDEMDGLMPGNNLYIAQHDLQIVEQFMIEISSLLPQHNVFLIGTTNHPGNIDQRILRGGRFSEKIEIGLPGSEELRKLLQKYLSGIRLEPSLTLEEIAVHLAGLAPADLEAISKTAKRFAFNRAGQDAQLPPLNLNDFTMAVERVCGAT